eukprot:g58258.t1
MESQSRQSHATQPCGRDFPRISMRYSCRISDKSTLQSVMIYAHETICTTSRNLMFYVHELICTTSQSSILTSRSILFSVAMHEGKPQPRPPGYELIASVRKCRLRSDSSKMAYFAYRCISVAG